MFNDVVLDTALDGGLKQQGVAEAEMQDAPLRVGMAARNAQKRKQPEKYAPSMQDNKYKVSLAQITTS